MLLSPLGESLGEGVTQETVFAFPLTWPLPQGGEEHEGRQPCHFAGERSSTQMSSGYWCVISVGLACRPWIHGW
jgi:hypothetical protein